MSRFGYCVWWCVETLQTGGKQAETTGEGRAKASRRVDVVFHTPFSLLTHTNLSPMSANNDKRDPSNFSFMGRVLGLSGGPPSAPTPVPHSSPVSIAAPPHGVKTQQQQPASPVSHPEM